MPKLIKNWPEAWKWWSMHGALTVAILSAIYAAAPALQSVISPTIYAWLMFVLGVVIMVLRVLQQPVPKKDSGDGLDME